MDLTRMKEGHSAFLHLFGIKAIPYSLLYLRLAIQ